MKGKGAIAPFPVGEGQRAKRAGWGQVPKHALEHLEQFPPADGLAEAEEGGRQPNEQPPSQ